MHELLRRFFSPAGGRRGRASRSPCWSAPRSYIMKRFVVSGPRAASSNTVVSARRVSCPERGLVRSAGARKVLSKGEVRGRSQRRPTTRSGRQAEQARPVVHQHDPLPRHGRGPESQLRPPRTAHGCGRDGVRSLDAVLETQPSQRALAEPRPLRSFRGPRVHASLQPAPPDRLRTFPRRDQAVPPVGKQDARASRAPAGGRD